MDADERREGEMMSEQQQVKKLERQLAQAQRRAAREQAAFERERARHRREDAWQDAKSRVYGELSDTYGRFVGMARLAEIAFQKTITDQYNQTEARQIRRMIHQLRQGSTEVGPLPIVSKCCSIAGGYALANGSELKKYIQKKKQMARKILALAARLEKLTLPEVLNQMLLEERGADGAAKK